MPFRCWEHQEFALARYRPNGTLDTSFSGDGTVLTDFGSGSDDYAGALAFQPGGKILVAGYSSRSLWDYATCPANRWTIAAHRA
jgi:hypothetical protein